MRVCSSQPWFWGRRRSCRPLWWFSLGKTCQDSLLCNHSSQTWQPSSGFVPGSVGWIGWGGGTLMRHTQGLDLGCFYCFGTFLRLCLMNPSILLPLAVTVSACLFQERSLVCVTHRYLLDSSTARVWPWSMQFVSLVFLDFKVM